MAKKRRRSSSTTEINPDPEEIKLPTLPPWYIRVSIYCAVLCCFAFVFIMGPDSFGHDRSKSDEGVNAPYSPNVISWDNYHDGIKDDFCYESGGIQPTFQICSMQTHYDREKQKYFVGSGFVENFQTAFRSYPKAGFLDIGRSAGFFTLLAAKLGKMVVVVNPFATDLILLQESARRNKVTEKIILMQNAISSTYEKIPFDETYQRKDGDTIYIDSITLNDVAIYANFDDVVIRIEIDGQKECEAFDKSNHLFQTKTVRYIFMELHFLFAAGGDEKCWKSMTEHFNKYGLKPFSISGVELHANDWYKSSDTNYVIWKQ